VTFPTGFLEVLLYLALGLTLCGAGLLIVLWILDMREKRLW
jgi:hypothetical protein